MGITTHKSHQMMEAYYKVNTDMKRQAMKKFTKENLVHELEKGQN